MYKLFYNLNDSPFDLKPDPKYFYTTRPHKRAIMHLRLGFEQPDGVLVLTGEKGIGKTSLITHMLEQLNKNDNIAAFIQKSSQKDHDLLPSILTALQIPVAERQPKVMFDTLHKFILEQAKQNKKILLVVDDAESLSHNYLEFIRLLSTLQHNGKGLIQIVLVGTDELDETLAANENQSFKQHIVMSYCMHPLQNSDTREYIEHRLKIAGSNGDLVIDQAAFEAIHQLTGGIPSEINRYCDRLLMLGMLCKTHHLNSDDVASLTSTTLDKFEKFKTVRLVQKKGNEFTEAIAKPPLPKRNEQKKVEPVQQANKITDDEKNILDTPVKKSKTFFDKGRVITIAAAFVVSLFSAAMFFKMSDNNLTSAHAETSTHQSAAHTDTNTTTDSHAAIAHDNHEPVAQAHNDVAAEFTSHQQVNESTPATGMLSIGRLSNKSRGTGAELHTELHNSQRAENVTSEKGHNLSKPNSNTERLASSGTIAAVIKSMSASKEPLTSPKTGAILTPPMAESNKQDLTHSKSLTKPTIHDMFVSLSD